MIILTNKFSKVYYKHKNAASLLFSNNSHIKLAWDENQYIVKVTLMRGEGLYTIFDGMFLIVSSFQ